MSLHAVVIRTNHERIPVHEEIECACGGLITTREPQSEAWAVERAMFLAEHKDHPA